MSKVTVSKVEIVIGEQTIKLSLEEARELLEVLEKTLTPEDKETTKIVERIIEHDRWIPQPYRWYGPYWAVTTNYSTGGNFVGDDPGQTLRITSKAS